MSADSRLPLPFSRPEEVGLSSERLARIRPAMQKFVDQKKVPNIVTLIAREGKVVHFEAQGYLDVENKIPVTKDTIFRLYSNSKPIAGAAIMILNEEGLLNLDDPVSKFIPAFKNPLVLASGVTERMQPGPPSMIRTVPARREITIRDCLRNTTGLATPQRSPAAFLTQFREMVEKSGWDLSASLNLPPQTSFRQRVEAHARLPLSYEPGTDFDYHVGYLAIGVIIETITHKTLEEFYHERTAARNERHLILPSQRSA
jgi:CubicO group peptidase (beta-lactamase class C family)